MENKFTLIYALERQIGLSPDRSNCISCASVEYIYFTGVVCHAGLPSVDAAGKCQDYQEDEEWMSEPAS